MNLNGASQKKGSSVGFYELTAEPKQHGCPLCLQTCFFQEDNVRKWMCVRQRTWFSYENTCGLEKQQDVSLPALPWASWLACFDCCSIFFFPCLSFFFSSTAVECYSTFSISFSSSATVGSSNNTLILKVEITLLCAVSLLLAGWLAAWLGPQNFPFKLSLLPSHSDGG